MEATHKGGAGNESGGGEEKTEQKEEKTELKWCALRAKQQLEIKNRGGQKKRATKVK